MGSGVYWRRHIKKHNCTWDTQIIGHYPTPDDLRAAGEHHSLLWDIVNSKEWANCIPEIGDGGPTVKGKVRAYNINNQSESKFYNTVGEIPDGWKRGTVSYKRTAESVEQTRKFHTGRKRTDRTRQNMRDSARRKRITVQCDVCKNYYTPQNIQRHVGSCAPQVSIDSNEEWRTLDFAPDYKVSNTGLIKTAHGIMSTTKRPSGSWVCLRTVSLKTKEFKVHILVAYAFRDDYNKGVQIYHIDGNKHNNHIDNLSLRVHPSPRTKCSDDQINKILISIQNGTKVVDVAKSFNISYGTVYNIIKKHRSV